MAYLPILHLTKRHPSAILLLVQLMGMLLLEAVFYFYAVGSLIAYMMEDRRATTDELFVGLLYLAGVVARLIGLTMQSHKDGASKM